MGCGNIFERLCDAGCDPTVAQNISNAQNANIHGTTVLAKNALSPIVAAMYQTASCLDQLLPNLNYGGFGDGLGSLANDMNNAVCNYIQQFADPYVGDVNSWLGEKAGQASNLLSLPGVDGINLGTLGGITTNQIYSGHALASLYASRFPESQYYGSNSYQAMENVLSHTKDSLGLGSVSSSGYYTFPTYQ